MNILLSNQKASLKKAPQPNGGEEGRIKDANYSRVPTEKGLTVGKWRFTNEKNSNPSAKKLQGRKRDGPQAQEKEFCGVRDTNTG